MTSDSIRDGLARYDQIVVERSSANNRTTQRLGLIRDDVDPEALVELITIFFEGFVLRGKGDLVTDRKRVLGLFIEAIAGRIIDDDHPLAPEFHRRLEEAIS